MRLNSKVNHLSALVHLHQTLNVLDVGKALRIDSIPYLQNLST